MAQLSAAERKKVRDALMRLWSSLRSPASFVKADLAAAVTAIDTFLDNNRAAINNAFPEPFKSEATAAQKALVVVYVIMRRYWPGRRLPVGDDEEE